MASGNRLSPIPHPPTKPVVGNMLSLDSTAPVQHLVKLSKELGPIFWLDMMGAPLVIVSGHDLVDELSDEKRFDKAVRGSLRRVRAVGGDGLFTADTKEPNWSKAHNILMQPFGNRAMQSYHPSMVDIAEQLVKKWERLNADEEIEVVHDMTALTLDTIGLCGFDYRFNSFYRRDYHPFVESLVRSLETIMMTRGLPLEGLWMQKRRKTLADDVAFMNKMVDEIIAERRGNTAATDDKKDMLAAMMTGVDRATGEQLDDVNIRYQINTFLIAGHETTSGLLSCTIYALLKHPEVLKKAYEEVDRVLGPDVNARPTYQQVTQLTYITQCLKEALRLWPPAPAYGIAPLADETIGGKYKLKKNTFITILVMALHRDPSVWGPNPDVFDPENFSREAEAKRPINAWKPFGNGQRACIGRGFAMHEAALAIGMILQRFKLLDVHRYQMHLKETLTVKPDGFRIKVRPRDDKDRGAFAGSTGAVAAAPKAQRAPATRPGHNTPMLVLYGSNLGSAEELATRMADLSEINGFATRLGPLDDYVGKLPEEGGVLIICASYNGAAPDNATRFVKWLESDLPKDAFAKVRYAVFGCGNSDWAATYQSVPRFIDEQLTKHGARAVYPRGEGDARSDLDGQFQKWFPEAAKVATKEFGIDWNFTRTAEDEPLYAIEPVAQGAVNTIVTQGGAVPMKVLANSELQTKAGAHPSERSTRHIEVELPASLKYRVGDHLSVVPRNDPTLVDSVARRFGFLPADQIRLQVSEGRRAQLPVGNAVSVGRLLTEFVELQQVATRKQIQIMAEHTRCPVTKPKLMAYVGDDDASAARYRTEVLAKRKSVFDLLEEYPACELPFHLYLEMLSLLAPRYYSISSSPAGEAQRCSVTVGVVEAPASSGRGIYKGVCSNYLARRRAGDTVHATIKETKAGFRLPDDNAVPIIMIGPGTGLAPFRGFLQERAARRAQGATLGPAMLFFGCRHPEQDFIYADELKAFAADGVSELHTAFSRADGPKTYVQHLVAAQKDRVWELIQKGAIVYVCGDGGRMEPDVKATLMSIYRERTGVDADAAARWIEEMGTRNRYVLDVWAGG
ncbi:MULTISPECIES: bifunctional cytochrome P450/NADPH--P450 reductase [Bradyrhizobium]|uniref:Bifunctional cytochrome P450/NADPH--P450 reductase n=1 Tax=Bradyrhizobium elkanii TaxID=29448 RepID=A0A8I2C8G1_BRAEL|nr:MULTISPECIES: cytochrome P450 [Bradyrhizobium]MBP1299064.1 cytochrome P450/NADPH-cytochrome P450 reductase [Bradyrhizobium elkanii]MCP1930077.1 cytochrome P450/NADPH-cytochrome P450 reductase [Bradyrhizobium elkanii]MCS3481664.1 cytochrome P450/NADPH-cytochrome P450 reductase [Bradyrhizobium elkanii]MCS3579306.1 cytochrome P450/NADPH-cytochrome P450 reductase [Bradyrhizobium elkanii]MCS3722179.1 cytochrome P450/NADPH-cytochrome P450 reductase [Bradyrhizobium elkanii]